MTLSLYFFWRKRCVNMNKIITVLIAGLMLSVLIPSSQAAEGDAELSEEEMQAAYDEGVEFLNNELTRASALSEEEAVLLMADHLRGNPIEQDERNELFLYVVNLVDPATDVIADPAFVQLVMGELLSPSTPQNYAADEFNQHSTNMAGVYAAASEVPEVAAEVTPQNLRSTGSHITGRTVHGGSWSHQWSEATTDFLFGVALDAHQDVDSMIVQTGMTYRVDIYRYSHLHYYCSWWTCYWYTHTHTSVYYSTPARVIASDVTFEHAFPAGAGQFATRAESSDALMLAYDALGNLNHQKAREATAAPPADPELPPEVPALPPAPGLPPEVPSTPEGRPGLGDLGAQSPQVNYFGTQADKSMVPPAPPEAPDTSDVPEVRNRDNVDPLATGVTAGHQATTINSWESNLLFVRWNNVGTGTEGATTTLGENPASFFYEAGSYFNGPGGTVKSFDFSIAADVTAV